VAPHIAVNYAFSAIPLLAGALTAFFWAALVRVALLYDVTWSVNSICHMIGEAAFLRRGPFRQLLAACPAEPKPRHCSVERRFSPFRGGWQACSGYR
jgi:hypothetical protein